ncbi:MAG: wax ester/triacylglycerol synthase family O-acyltransferase [Gordonia sp. (in: high G+C Gram-positive bacteria)]
MEYMPVTESMFLIAETRDQPMHVGGLQLFIPREGQSPEDLADEMHDAFIAATDIHPTFLKRPASPASIVGYTAWSQEEELDFDYHVRRISLPRPGEIKDLLRYVSLNHGALLDRSQPMWETHIIEGLKDGRIAMYTKVHHSLIDGVSALRILQRTLSTDPTDRSGTAFWDRNLKSRSKKARAPKTKPEPTLRERIAGAWSSADQVLGMVPAAAKVALTGARDKDFIAPFPNAPQTILNVPIGSARRFAAQDWPTERLRQAARRHGLTVTEVMIAMCAGALRTYLLDHDALPEESLTAMLPVSMHTEDSSGNQVTAVIVKLATDSSSPIERLHTIRASTTSAKKMVRGLRPLQSLALGAANLAPMAMSVVPGATKITPRNFNVIISCVPGPDDPLYWNGAKLDGCYPVSIPAEGQAMNITTATVGGKINFGIIGARAELPSVQRMLDHLETALAELEELQPQAF